MIYPIVAFGDPILKKRALDIETGKDIKQLVEDMFETMYTAHGVGLAAPQIGMNIRLFVVDPEGLDEESLKGFKKVFVNPEIIEETEEEWPFEEGCLSIPGIRGDVNRPEKIKLHYFDVDWKEHIEEFDGLKARVIQHEYDHIEGKLFVDYFSSLKKKLLKAKLTNISKGKVDVEYKMKFPVKK